MNPTLEEVKKVANECGAHKRIIDIDAGTSVIAFTPEQLQAFAQHYKEEGRKEQQSEIDRLRGLCQDAYHELNCGEDGDVFERTHHCGRCDNSIDRNGTLRGKLALAFVFIRNNTGE